MYQWNRLVHKLTCLRCKDEYAAGDYLTGCPRCLENGYPSNLRVDYRVEPQWEIDQTARGMFRYAGRLPYRTFPTLGEGGTPITEINGLESKLGISSVWVKNEGQNPTGSHKDRMSPLVVARAAELKRYPVVAASSGNAGASLAAYAAAAGIPCTIVTTSQLHDAWENAIRITGANIVTATNSLERWELVRKMVENEGAYAATNFIKPAVGSNFFGIQGYKTVGYEIVEQMRHNMPTAIVVPCARGDLIWGIWAGLEEARSRRWIENIPRLYAVEPFPRLTHVLAGHDYRQTFEGDSRLLPSIGGDTVTYQTVAAVQSSHGAAVVVSNEEVFKAQADMGERGFYAESSSAVTWAAASKLIKMGLIGEHDRTLLLVTSHGYKGVIDFGDKST